MKNGRKTRGGYSIYSWVGRCGAAPQTLTLFKTNIADFPRSYLKQLTWCFIRCEQSNSISPDIQTPRSLCNPFNLLLVVSSLINYCTFRLSFTTLFFLDSKALYLLRGTWGPDLFYRWIWFLKPWIADWKGNSLLLLLVNPKRIIERHVMGAM